MYNFNYSFHIFKSLFKLANALFGELSLLINRGKCDSSGLHVDRVSFRKLFLEKAFLLMAVLDIQN